MSDFELTVLGTASALPMAHRYPSAQVLSVPGRLFLIDCGEGTQMQLRRGGFSFLKIEAVFLSHTHGDHCFGIFGLLSTMSMLGREQPLKVYAPVTFAPILDFFLRQFGGELRFPVEHVALEMNSPQCIYTSSKMTVDAFPLEHVVPCYGFLFRQAEPPLNIRKERLEQYHLSIAEIAALKRGEDVLRPAGPFTEPCAENGFVPQSGTDAPCLMRAEDFTYVPYRPASYAYCSDTRPFPRLADWVRGVSLLYHEATYLADMEDKAFVRGHSTAAQAARCARDAGASRLMLGHFSSKVTDHQLFLEEAREIFPACCLANELESYDICGL